LQLLHSEFPYIWGKFDFLIYPSKLTSAKRPMKYGLPASPRAWVAIRWMASAEDRLVGTITYLHKQRGMANICTHRGARKEISKKDAGQSDNCVVRTACDARLKGSLSKVSHFSKMYENKCRNWYFWDNRNYFREIFSETLVVRRFARNFFHVNHASVFSRIFDRFA
jgi:hypothetical protein